jgi:HEPN domain-containing protein
MTKTQTAARGWIDQARNDLKFAQAAFREGFYSQCCFICQQVGEKALKAVLVSRRRGIALTHSIRDLCRMLKVNGQLLKAASILDQYYVTARYPNVLPGQPPFMAFHRDQAKEAIQFAALLTKKAERLLGAKG